LEFIDVIERKTMKHILIAVVFLLLLSTMACFSATVNFAWDVSSDDATLGATGGYCLLQSKTSQSYGAVCAATVPPGVHAATVTVPNGTYYWVVYAFDSDGNKSGYSNEVTAKVNPGKPNNLKIP
jgi:hypothetical protein